MTQEQEFAVLALAEHMNAMYPDPMIPAGSKPNYVSSTEWRKHVVSYAGWASKDFIKTKGGATHTGCVGGPSTKR